MRPTAGKAALRPAQKRQALGLVVETPQVDRAVSAGDGLDLLDQVVDLGRRAVELDDQQGLDVERIAGLDEGLGGVRWPGGPSSPCRPG